MTELLRELIKLAPARWAATLAAALALGFMVWYIGPVIAIAGYRPFDGTVARLIAVAAILLAWAGANLIKHLHQRRTNKKMIAGLAGAEQPADAEMATLRQRLEEALRHLRRLAGTDRRKRQYLYELPWYLLIGPPGSGKTTALINCGLKFPLSDRFGKKPLRGVAGTRNCDWFLTDEAVLVDTAGRYTTQDSDEKADQAAWLGFLDLLKEFRPRQPVNGVLVAISLTDLAMLPETERLAHARAIRQRLAELLERFKVRLPVYIVFTKADLIAGFVETYETLTGKEREQVWGTTFRLDPGGEADPVVAQFDDELRLLLARLDERMFDRIQQEADVGRRGLIFGLPTQLVSLAETTREFLEEIFLASRYETRPLLRGVYFTSGTQEGTPIDRLMGAIAQRFGLQRSQLIAFSGAGRSYFLTRLLREVVFAEASIVSTDPRVERRRKLARWSAYAVGALLFIMACGAWTVSYIENSRAEAQVRAAVDAATTETAKLDTPVLQNDDPSLVLPALDRLRRLPGGYEAKSGPVPISLNFGLYQGAKLRSQEIAAYRRGLNLLLLPRLLSRLQQELAANMAQADVLYDGLKVYLMLGGQHAVDPVLVTRWMRSDWQKALPGPGQAATRDALLGHLDALLEAPLEQYPLDRTVVEEGRRVLRQSNLARRAYLLLKERVAESSSLVDWWIADHGGPAADRVLTRSSGKPLSDGIPGLYTREGFYHAVLPRLADTVAAANEESWVLSEPTASAPAQAATLESDVLALYYDDYVRSWEEILDDVSVQPLHNMAQAAEVLNSASGISSPLKLVWQAIDRETQLSQSPESAGRPASSNAPAPSPGSRTAPAATSPSYGLPVEDRFRQFHEFVSASGGHAPIDEFLNDFSALYLQVNRLIVSAPPGSPGEANAVADATAAARKLENQAVPLPTPVAVVAGSVAHGVSALITGGAKDQIALGWAQILSVCTQAIEGRYPARRDSTVDVAPEDFAKLFSPNGLIDGFFNSELRHFVDISHIPWKAQTTEAGGGISLSNDALLQFQRAARIRDAFFPTGATPMVRFEVNPISLDTSSARAILNIEGQEINYDGGASRPLVMQWPGPTGVRQSSIAFEPKPAQTQLTGPKPTDPKPTDPKPTDSKQAEPVTISTAGAWSLFRLLDAGRLEKVGGPDRWRISFSVGTHRAVFELHTGSVVNPLESRDIVEFRCPRTLVTSAQSSQPLGSANRAAETGCPGWPFPTLPCTQQFPALPGMQGPSYPPHPGGGQSTRQGAQ